MRRRPVGKISLEQLKKSVFPYTGAHDSSVLLGPEVGEDTALIDLGPNVLILKADPVTGAVERAGWLSVHVNANDVATRGAEPRWFLPTLIMPTTSTVKTVEEIMRQIHEAATELGVAIVGGHTEFIDGIDHPIIAGTMAAVIEKDRYVTSGGARPGDKIILTKGAAIECTVILATDMSEEIRKELGSEIVERGKAFIQKISIVKDALIAVKNGKVTAMHDATEGGVATALHEVAEASNIGFMVYEDKIYVAPETNKMCLLFDLDPLQVISSGALIITATSKTSQKIVDSLNKAGIKAEIIGEATDKNKGRSIVKRDGSIVNLPLPEQDQLWKLSDAITAKARMSKRTKT
ncbi:MAG: AIR synthase family protein [Promethearchaeota archaeon]